MENATLKVYTLDQCADIISRRKKTLYRAVADGSLVAHKIGHGWLVFEQDLINYISNAPCGKKRSAQEMLSKNN